MRYPSLQATYSHGVQLFRRRCLSWDACLDGLTGADIRPFFHEDHLANSLLTVVIKVWISSTFLDQTSCHPKSPQSDPCEAMGRETILKRWTGRQSPLFTRNQFDTHTLVCDTYTCVSSRDRRRYIAMQPCFSLPNSNCTRTSIFLGQVSSADRKES